MAKQTRSTPCDDDIRLRTLLSAPSPLFFPGDEAVHYAALAKRGMVERHLLPRGEGWTATEKGCAHFASRAAVMVETIVEAYLADRTTEGDCGTLVEVGDGEKRIFRVTAGGTVVIVRPYEGGWDVSFKGSHASAGYLYQAARDALEGGLRSNVSTVAAALS